MSGNPLNDRTYADENVCDAKTDNDRRKHHHMLELVCHFNSFACGLFVRPNENKMSDGANYERCS